jgi:hypothetical protein
MALLEGLAEASGASSAGLGSRRNERTKPATRHRHELTATWQMISGIGSRNRWHGQPALRHVRQVGGIHNQAVAGTG